MVISENVTINKMIADPYKDINLSLLIPCKDFESFLSFYQTLLKHGPEICNDVEIILKIDCDEDISSYYSILENSHFYYKILVYPKYYARYSLHHFFNDMYAVSSGKIIWILFEDAKVVAGNWYNSLINTRNRFKDNIYYVNVPMDNGKGSKQIIGSPAISREWCEILGGVAKTPNVDRWLYELSRSIDRQIILREDELLINFPKGARVLSKQQRKDIFYPLLKKEIKKLKKKLKK